MNLDKTTDGSINHRALQVNARRLVIKVGTGVVCNSTNEFDPLQTAALANSIARLAKEGRQVVLVSSGAVAEGMPHRDQQCVVMGYRSIVHRVDAGVACA